MLYITGYQIQRVGLALLDEPVDKWREKSLRLVQLDRMIGLVDAFLWSYQGMHWAISSKGWAYPLKEHFEEDPVDVYHFQDFDESITFVEYNRRIEELLKPLFKL